MRRPLTEREQVVVSEVTIGTPLKLIGWRLSISTQAVSIHLLRAQQKLGAKSRRDLLAIGGKSVRSLNDIHKSGPNLTAAELAVGNAIVEGEPYASIAMIRNTSVRTVQHQAREVFRKCGVLSRFELAALAYGNLSRRSGEQQ